MHSFSNLSFSLWLTQILPPDLSALGLPKGDGLTQVGHPLTGGCLSVGCFLHLWNRYEIVIIKGIGVLSCYFSSSSEAYMVFNVFFSLCLSTCPRAKLFAREQGLVKSLEGLQKVLRLNKYQDDPLSEGNPASAIAARAISNRPRPADVQRMEAAICTRRGKVC